MKRKLDKLESEQNRLQFMFNERVKIYNKKYYKRQTIIRDNMKYIRSMKRRASDGQIKIKRHYDPFYESLKKIKTRKRLEKDMHAGSNHLPKYADRFFHSCIWEKFDFKTSDELDYHQAIFRMRRPTENKMVLGENADFSLIEDLEEVSPLTG